MFGVRRTAVVSMEWGSFYSCPGHQSGGGSWGTPFLIIACGEHVATAFRLCFHCRCSLLNRAFPCGAAVAGVVYAGGETTHDLP